MKLLAFVVVLALAVFLVVRSGGRASSAEARAWVAAGARLVDVRSPEEYGAGHIEGALNIPVGDVERRAAEIGPKGTRVVVYCRSGSRSAAAKRALGKVGYDQVLDLGAMSSW